MESATKGPVGIGGWLLLPALGLIATPLLMAFGFYKDLLPALAPNVWNLLTDPHSAAYNRFWGPLIVYEVLINLALFVFTLWLLWVFFTKSQHAPKLFVIWLAAIAGTRIIDYLLFSQIPAISDKSADPATATDLVRSIVGAAIWIPYFLRSERVKNTFIKPVS
jgi:Protein of unknown function (DUF2569)